MSEHRDYSTKIDFKYTQAKKDALKEHAAKKGWKVGTMIKELIRLEMKDNILKPK